MKFKLIEDINRGHEDVSSNELLVEKQWVEVESNAPTRKPFYFYTTNSNPQKDVDTLIPSITNTREGSYKQQLDKDILYELKQQYELCKQNGIPFKLNILKQNVSVDKLIPGRVLTLTDRDLRRVAHDNLHISDDYLIHHRTVGEYDNNVNNVILIDKSTDLYAAHAIHKFMENKGPNIPLGTTTIDLMEFDTNSGKWVNTHVAEITIR